MKSQEMNNNSIMELDQRSGQEGYSYAEVMRALEEGRTVQGVFDCAQALEMEPDNVMMCILREGDRNDISVKIQHTLIEAYCWENDIRVLKVSPEDKLDVMLANELNLNRSKEENSCALVMLPNKDTTTEELSEDDGWIQTDILLPG